MKLGDGLARLLAFSVGVDLALEVTGLFGDCICDDAVGLKDISLFEVVTDGGVLKVEVGGREMRKYSVFRISDCSSFNSV